MKLEDLEKVSRAASSKKCFEHAARCMVQGVTMTFAFRGKTEKVGGQVHITLNEQTANELCAIFERDAATATDELTALGVDVRHNVSNEPSPQDVGLD